MGIVSDMYHRFDMHRACHIADQEERRARREAAVAFIEAGNLQFAKIMQSAAARSHKRVEQHQTGEMWP